MTATRTGALLPTALAVMVLIGLAASAALYMSRTTRAASASALLQTAVTSSADEAEAMARSISGPRASRMRVGESISEHAAVSNHGVRATWRLTRLGASSFALAVAASAGDPAGRTARRGAVLLLRLRPPRLHFPAALVLAPGGSAPPGVADGTDRPPDGWDCDAESDPVPDELHPLVSPSDSAELDGLRQRAAIRLPAGYTAGVPGPVVRDGDCNTSNAGNWGDPTRGSACAGWLPVVHAAGDLTVVGGTGQGVLLVDGDLHLSGGFVFVGAVIVAGRISVGPGGSGLIGGVRAGGIVDAGGLALPSSSIARSSCALRDAMLAAGTLGPVSERPWAPER